MAKLEIETTDTNVHTKATQLGIPHKHECRGYSSMKVWFDFDLPEVEVIAKGFNITVNNKVSIPYFGKSDEDFAEMLADANFDPLAFLDKVAEAMAAAKAEDEQKALAEQREREEKQRREFAKKQARELLAEDFKAFEREIADLKETILRREERIDKLSKYLEALIKASANEALEEAGLIQKRVGYGEDEEPELTAEQQEALQTTGLDC